MKISSAESILITSFALVSFIIGIKLGETHARVVEVPKVTIEYIPMAWWFKGNTLYWAFDGKFEDENCLQFQLDKKIPPTVNQEPIQRIWITQDFVIVITKDKYWKVHYSKNPEEWYVDDWLLLNP